VQREGVRWCREVAGQRIHGTTRKRPIQVFEAAEKAKLAPLARPRFDPPAWSECKVHPDHHVQFQKAIYSVPTRHVGKKVWVRGDSKLVRIYVQGELVKTHERVASGCRSTDYADYPPERAPYAMRDATAIVEEAKRRGGSIGRFAEQLLTGPFPWAKLRQAQKLLRLGQRYGFERLDSACRRAVSFELWNVKRVEQIMLASLEPADTPPPQGELIPLPARFLRPTDHFTHASPEAKETHGDPAIAQDPSQTLEALGAAADAAGSRRLRPEDEAS